MESCNITQRIVSIIALGFGLCFNSYAMTVYTYGGQFDLRIPSDPDTSKGWMDDAIIDIPHQLTIRDIDVCISLSHTKVFDLQLFLQSPSGTRICLNKYNPLTEYFEGQDYIQTVFDDEADVPIEQAEPPFTGRFKPKAPYMLEVFDGENTFGLWRLQIYDAFYADTGRLNSFELMVAIPEPATVILLSLGSGLAILLRPRRKP